MDPDTVFLAMPVWLLITPLIGIINGAVFYLVVGRGPASLPYYLLLAVISASVMQWSGLIQAGSPPYSLGDVQVIAASLSAWSVLTIFRVAGL